MLRSSRGSASFEFVFLFYLSFFSILYLFLFCVIFIYFLIEYLTILEFFDIYCAFVVIYTHWDYILHSVDSGPLHYIFLTENLLTISDFYCKHTGCMFTTSYVVLDMKSCPFLCPFICFSCQNIELS